ncbi:MAG TPA: 5-methyltetrahydrofolate--homocysteine methyltransferase [Caldithrix abyssi]|uniref:5-methyltetrahydrofolate--homocysteine methyltransferase n=1 Tax=Caldithrix abyssi TaxID=187145 RepID=A0A7V4WW62_CALAY|nr:5-methyltetrahydrofolate--homocysteine methyltransferase [Caldithrix abyssi]
MANDLLRELNSGKILLSDGAMGTELQKRGMPAGSCPELLNIEQPDVVQSVYRDYYQAGSDIVETNTFGGNRFRLKHYGYEKRVSEFCRRAAELAKEICPAGKYVAGSIGPSGEILEPLGSMSATEAYDAFAEQAAALAAGGADVLFVETMMDVEEAVLAVRAAKEATDLPVSGTMTFDLTDSGPRTSYGTDAATAVQRLSEAGADILGANCGNGMEVVLQTMKVMRPLTEKPLLAQPNAGIPEMVDKALVYSETPETMRDKYKELIDMGVNIIGGCCGTNAEYIRMLRRLIG